METTQDATAADSSTASTQSGQSPDAVSSTANATASGSSDKTLADVVTAAANASQAQGSDAKGSGTEPVPDGKKASINAGEKEEPITATEAQDDSDPDKGLPFAEHPRWKEVYGKMKDSERELETYRAREAEVKPFVEAQQATNDFCQRNRITVQQFRDMLEVQALINNDPEKALARLEPLYNRLASLAGKAPTSVLDPDLQEALRTGKLDETYAQQIQAGRARQSFAQERVKASEYDQQAFIQQANSDAVAQWARDMASRDTAFKPATNGTDGVFELTTAFLGDACRRTPPRTPVEATRLAQQAYDKARKIIAPTAPKPRTTSKTLPPNGSSAKNRELPKNLSEVVLGVANGTLKPGDITNGRE